MEMARLTIAFSKNFDDARAQAVCEVFADALADFDIDEIRAAVRERIRESQFFPSPHELVALIRRNRGALLAKREEAERHAGWRSRAALPPSPEAEAQERAEAAPHIAKFREIVESIAEKYSTGASSRPAADAERERHEDRKKSTLDDYRRQADEVAGGLDAAASRSSCRD